MSKITSWDPSALPCHIAASVPRGDQPLHFDRTVCSPKSLSRTALTDAVDFALAASSEALQMAGWRPESEMERQMTGVAIGG